METVTMNDADTPLMKQYKKIKSEYSDCILFFRLGDFYEMFNEDAKLASKVLGLMLTKRQQSPMCGVPYHSALTYISKLINQGFKVAICEQVGDEDTKTKLFKRKVIRVITPGTIIEENLLNSKSSNYLCALIVDIVGWGMSWLDVSTGEFYSINNLDDKNFNDLNSLISRVSPKEVVADSKTIKFLNDNRINFFRDNIYEFHCDFSSEPAWSNEPVWQNNKLALKAAMLALSYIKSVQPEINAELKPYYYDDNKTLKLDESAIKTLELVEPDYEGGHSLFDVIDNSKTAMGSRLIKKWILNPLYDYYLVNKRLNAVDYFYQNDEAMEKLWDEISRIADIERVSGRIINMTTTPADLIGIKNAIKRLDDIKKILNENGFVSVIPEVVRKINSLDTLKNLFKLINEAIDENSSLKVGEGELFKKGYSADYDELKSLISNSQGIISGIEQSERERTGISSLKIGYNSNFGYFIEITKANISKTPENYIRKQTLTSSERFITPELKSIEEKILSASEKIKKLEQSLFREIKDQVLLSLDDLMSYSSCVAYIDALCSLAYTARKNQYVRPEIVSDDIIEIENGRHPVVEQFLPPQSFVSNNLNFNENLRSIILTGPNMSGKSVYLRQNALIVIMAQMGSFVPADKARLGLVDRIMTRIGAHDRLVRGESTFMVEMKETSSILKLATKKSLILLDEVGRGTSTFDGIGIAYAVLEYIHKNIGSKVLFATHFFEITKLAEKYDGVENFNISVKEWVNSKGKTEISFLHRVVKGSADKSYGVHVAQIAGLPEECIKRAREILNKLETREIDLNTTTNVLPLFSSNPLIDKIRMIDLNKLTPLDALNILNELKKEADE
ncbi:MAG: DNA mismatch repair protein MutS [Elusimicrobiales bacterium]|nr:DNA mismatch repair protein MutS [Elusimicrobiales bacterium]